MELRRSALVAHSAENIFYLIEAAEIPRSFRGAWARRSWHETTPRYERIKNRGPRSPRRWLVAPRSAISWGLPAPRLRAVPVARPRPSAAPGPACPWPSCPRSSARRRDLPPWLCCCFASSAAAAALALASSAAAFCASVIGGGAGSFATASPNVATTRAAAEQRADRLHRSSSSSLLRRPNAAAVAHGDALRARRAPPRLLPSRTSRRCTSTRGARAPTSRRRSPCVIASYAPFMPIVPR